MTDWTGCYRRTWSGLLVPEAFSHPAKAARGLSERIYAHAFEMGWLREGSVVVDPFFGVGGFAFESMRRGCTFIGVELERPFVDMAQGCECAGVSKENWVRFYGRLESIRYEWGRTICPRCLSEAKQVVERDLRQTTLFGEHPSAAYIKHSGKIPTTPPHHYTGNLELWARMGLKGTARVFQGDSRKLLTWGRLEPTQGQVDLCCGSPPFHSVSHSDWHVDSSPERIDKLFQYYKSGGGGMTKEQFRRHCEARQAGYGSSPGQLARMPEGRLEPERGTVDCVCSSPPFAGAQITDSRGKDHPYHRGKFSGNSWGKPTDYDYPDSPGQLANMREGSADACIGSPPYEASINESKQGARQPEREKNLGRPIPYGAGDNLGNSSGDTFWTAARQIVTNCREILKPGGVAIWVVKRYVKAGQIVPFPDQWIRLCESVGFSLVCRHRAWLVEEYGTQRNLSHEDEIDTVKRISFFRRIHSQKYPDLQILWEDVLCVRRP